MLTIEFAQRGEMNVPNRFAMGPALVMIDCLTRRAYITPDNEDYLEMIHAMRP
jgi:hypothetical protein